MSLAIELDRYLSIRRSLGYNLRVTAGRLRHFALFADSQSASHLDTALFLHWEASLPMVSRKTRAMRLGAVRGFSQRLHGVDPAHQILPKGLLPADRGRPRLHTYSETEIVQIIETAGKLPSIYGLGALTCSTLFGLIAATGLRISEALALRNADINRDGVLHVRRGKHGRARILPLHASEIDQLARYVRERDRLLGRKPEALFIAERGHPFTDCEAWCNFAAICRAIGLREPTRYRRHGAGPRIYDLRHTFAVRTMIGRYRAGTDPAREMIQLSTWIGHSDPANTFWYPCPSCSTGRWHVRRPAWRGTRHDGFAIASADPALLHGSALRSNRG